MDTKRDNGLHLRGKEDMDEQELQEFMELRREKIASEWPGDPDIDDPMDEDEKQYWADYHRGYFC